MKEIVKLGIMLLVIASIAAAGLGVVNSITEGPIAEQKRIAAVKARQEVLANADSFDEVAIEIEDPGLLTEINVGMKDGNIVGYTIKSVAKGYAGKVEVLVGIDPMGVVTGMTIGDHSETPGFGAEAENDYFKERYKGKTSDMELVVVKTGDASGNEIDSITGATISSRAITGGVNASLAYFNNYLK